MRLFGGSGPAKAAGRAIELDFVRGIAIMGFHFHAVYTSNFLIQIIEYPLKNFGREGVNLFICSSRSVVFWWVVCFSGNTRKRATWM